MTDRVPTQEGHEDRGDTVTDVAAGDVSGDHVWDRQSMAASKVEGIQLALRRDGLVVEEARPHVAAKHQTEAIEEAKAVHRC